jgi:hypothetical protein
MQTTVSIYSKILESTSERVQFDPIAISFNRIQSLRIDPWATYLKNHGLSDSSLISGLQPSDVHVKRRLLLAGPAFQNSFTGSLRAPSALRPNRSHSGQIQYAILLMPAGLNCRLAVWYIARARTGRSTTGPVNHWAPPSHFGPGSSGILNPR